jgi:hypothetical protein
MISSIVRLQESRPQSVLPKDSRHCSSTRAVVAFFTHLLLLVPHPRRTVANYCAVNTISVMSHSIYRIRLFSSQLRLKPSVQIRLCAQQLERAPPPGTALCHFGQSRAHYENEVPAGWQPATVRSSGGAIHLTRPCLPGSGLLERRLA